jgi:integrase/recombinase XerC
MVGVERFLQHLEQGRRYSVHTLRAYQNDLQQLSQYLSHTYQVYNLHEAQSYMIRSWMAGMINDGVSRATINRKRSAVKSFFKYAILQQAVDADPTEKIAPVKKEQKLPVFVEEESIERLFDQQEFEAGFEGTRDRLILMLFYTTGMRLAELIGLQHADIDTYNNTVKVLGKGNKQRIVPLLNEVKALYGSYCREKEKYFGPGHIEPLFVTGKGKKLYAKFVYRLVNLYLSKVTTRRKKSPHVLRHTFATHMLNHGADLNAIKEILGHASLSATQVYTHNSFAKIKSVYKQAHPKA